MVAGDEQRVRRLGDSGVSGISLWKSPLRPWLRAPPVRDGQASNDCADSPGAAGERFLIPVLSFMESLLFLDHTLPVAAKSSTVEG